MEVTYPGEREDRRAETVWAQAIEAIASRTGYKPGDVKAVYERIFSKMERGARIKDFVAVFAARKVERFLARKGSLLRRTA